MDILNILVLDDNPAHRASAERQLVGHDLTIVASYSEACDLLRNQKWDMVLLDLMLPASMGRLGGPGEKFEGQEMPLGTILAFQALHVGVKKVGILTDTNHHDHPASAAFDWVGGGTEKPIRIGDTRLFLTNYLNGRFAEYVASQTDQQIGDEEKPWLATCHILCSDTDWVEPPPSPRGI